MLSSFNDPPMIDYAQQKIHIFDTSVASKNLGDLIILDSVKSFLSQIFPCGRFFNSATHDVIGKASYLLNSESDFSFVAGTNLLSSNMNAYNQWKVNFYDAFFLNDIILMGVGWWQYQRGANLYTKLLYKSLLSKRFLHAVRDGYTKRMLAGAGIMNCINTGCPTTWMLTPQHCESIPKSKGTSVVFTLTDYKKDPDADLRLMQALVDSYDQLYFWPQGAHDLEYLQTFPYDGHILAPSLESFDSILLNSVSLDYVGTRLHAGIRALQHKRRSIIIGVDNRAAEIARDINLPFLARENMDMLEATIARNSPTCLEIDFDAIEIWRAQFTH